MNINELKDAVCAAVDRRRAKIIGIGEQIWRRPEPGFQEFETARLVSETLGELQMPFRDKLAITGARADLAGGAPGPTLALLGELDALILPAHPAADPRTGAVHACGHHAQIAAMLGAAMALRESGVMPHLAGRVACMAVPAEEYLQIEYRRQLAREGRIRFLGGKSEFIRLGLFDDVNLAAMIHAGPGDGFTTRSTMNGFLAKQVRFTGKASHAGARPQHGINALKAAMMGLQAVDAQRDTFADDDYVRVHPIITKGGDVVNIVPDDVMLESQVRARNIAAVTDAAHKFDRAMRAGAVALGAKVEIETLAGYLPLLDNPDLAGLLAGNAAAFMPRAKIKQFGHLGSSTDMGDVSQIMPATHPGIGGASTPAHTTEFRIVDPELAYVTAAKLLAMLAVELLADGAARATDVIKRHPPAMTIPDYCAFMERQTRTEHFDGAASAPAR